MYAVGVPGSRGCLSCQHGLGKHPPIQWTKQWTQHVNTDEYSFEAVTPACLYAPLNVHVSVPSGYQLPTSYYRYLGGVEE